jgi:hypothetical protein
MTLEEYPDCPWVCHFRGERIAHFRRAWVEGTKKAGLAGRLFHDLRRSAVRNMVQAGIPGRAASSIAAPLSVHGIWIWPEPS